jgi:hypothetical protein
MHGYSRQNLPVQLLTIRTQKHDPLWRSVAGGILGVAVCVNDLELGRAGTRFKSTRADLARLEFAQQTIPRA